MVAARHLLAIWLGIALLSGTIAFAVWNSQNTRAQQNQGLRTFICYFEDAVLKTPQSPAKRHTAEHFFTGVLEQIHQSPCTTPAPNQGGR